MSTGDGEAAGRGQPSASNRGTARGEYHVASKLSGVARDLEQQEDPDETLRAVVAAAIEMIPGTADGSISVVRGRRQVQSEAASSELAREIDSLQEKTGEGPCLDAVYEQQTVRVEDMRAEQRWPSFAAKAAEAGAASMLCFQLFVSGDNLGALNLYSTRAGAFDDESEHIGLLFSSHAALAYSAAKRESQLLRAVSTREVIGQAQGILMERYKLTADQAFGWLVKASQDANMKLRDIADKLVETGRETPPP